MALKQAPGGPSSSKVKRAGSLVRKASRGGQWEADAMLEAIEIIEAHRATFKTPLVTANNCLRSFVKTLGLKDAQVSQRLKRMQTILNKLNREPTLALDRMQDIGGCRVVLPTRSDVDSLVAYLGKHSRTIRLTDYVAKPRASGYRGVHVVMEYGPCPRPIEVQIRSAAMHKWATTVENISGESGINYKMDGATPMQLFLECYARVLECVDLEIPPPPELLPEYERLLRTAFGEELV